MSVSARLGGVGFPQMTQILLCYIGNVFLKRRFSYPAAQIPQISFNWFDKDLRYLRNRI